MILKEIIEKCSKLDVHEKRCVNDELYEVVFYNKDIDQWHKVFVDILGPPIKPAGEEPTEEDDDLTDEYGGIVSNQTLFKKDFDNVTILTMFWPWRDNIHTTLKTVVLKRK